MRAERAKAMRPKVSKFFVTNPSVNAVDKAADKAADRAADRVVDRAASQAKSEKDIDAAAINRARKPVPPVKPPSP